MLNLSNCYIGDYSFDIFTRSFTECSNNETTIESVDIANNHLTLVSVNGIISLINCFKAEKIALCNNSIDYEEFDNKLFESSISKTRIMKIVAEKIVK